ncbi:hypothetical protein PR048_015835 [Dryococelus australis]|uniref:Uncharacterized protein n=1 Tax=Dryococelus australis TaxID=614101 RepID=A0ABQ9HI19_9NEOP|nr:hypothetical protein PR048_015835 [Dryococelus australis]
MPLVFLPINGLYSIAACSLHNVVRDSDGFQFKGTHEYVGGKMCILLEMSFPPTSPAVKSLCNGETAGYEHLF